MIRAKSARVTSTLGASLVAVFFSPAVLAGSQESGTNAISGSGVDAISGSGVDAISGSGIHAISGSGVDAISGSGIHAISGSGVDAISGSGVDAISGSGVDAISGSGTEMLSGPVQSINRENGTFVSVGQTVMHAGSDLAALRVGDFVTVRGSLAGAGLINASEVLVSTEQYVAGSTQVSVTGIPSSIDYRFGTAKIGELTVDYTPSLGGSRFDGIGAAITVIGTQPALGGAMLGERVIDKTDLFLRD